MKKYIILGVITFFGLNNSVFADGHEQGETEVFNLQVQLCTLKDNASMKQYDEMIADYVKWSRKHDVELAFARQTPLYPHNSWFEAGYDFMEVLFSTHAVSGKGWDKWLGTSDGQKLNEDSPSLLLLPGSRQQEVNAHWEILLETVSKLKRIIKNLVVIVTPSPGVIIPNAPHDFVIEPSIKNAIQHSTAAIVSSGTATLECAVHNLPIVVCYKVSNISWYFAKFLSDIKFVSMVNLIAKKEIVNKHLANSWRF